MEVLRYHYRKMFKLTAREMEDEPADQFFTNLAIYGLIQRKREDDIKKAENGRR